MILNFSFDFYLNRFVFFLLERSTSNIRLAFIELFIEVLPVDKKKIIRLKFDNEIDSYVSRQENKSQLSIDFFFERSERT